MGLGTTLLLSNTISGAATWTLPSASFSGTQYLGPPIAPTNAGDSTGFEIDPAATLYIAFEGTYGTQTVVHEETLDPNGVTGWFPVVGYAVDGSSSGSGASTSGVCYAFQVSGVRHRIRVTALGSGTLACRVAIGSHSSVVVGDTATPGTPGPTATGNITNTQSVTLTFGSPNYSTFGYAISGTWTGLIVVEGTVDGTNWTATTAVPLNGTAVGAFTANSIGQGSAAGLAGIRFRGNTVTSGTATVLLVSSEGVSTVMQDNNNWSVNLAQVLGNNTVTAGVNGLLAVGGNVASGVADAGNPVKAGAVFTTAPPTITTGQRVDLQADNRGNLRSRSILNQTSGADGQSNGIIGFFGDTANSANLPSAIYGWRFNGTTWDRNYGNIDTAALVTLTAQAAGTVNSSDQVNFNGKGVNVVVDITAASAMTLTVAIQVKDTASGKYVTVLTSAAFAATGTNLLTVYPGVTATANVSASALLSRTWRVQAVVTGTSVTATIGASVIQ